jgi:hypothetical protein
MVGSDPFFAESDLKLFRRSTVYRRRNHNLNVAMSFFMAMWIVFLVLLVVTNGNLAKLGNLGNNTVNPPGSAVSTGAYLHWNCGGQSQCAQVMGGPFGIRDTGLAQTESNCQYAMNLWASQGVMQPFSGGVGAWCSSSSNPGDTQP